MGVRATLEQAPPLLYIDGFDDPASHWSPNTFHRHVLLHEYGHYVADKEGFFCDTGGYHRWDMVVPPKLAAVEGWGQFWSGTTSASPHCVRYNKTFNDSAYFDLETGWIVSLHANGSVNAWGDSNEISVAATLWDIVDPWDDDYSDQSHWGYLAFGPNPDGIGDTLCVSLHTLWEVLQREVTPGQQPQTLEEFWQAWFATQPTHFGHNQAMADIWYEHGIDGKSCCIGIRGNVDGDLEEKINVADMTTLIAYLFKGYTGVTCLKEADVNGDGSINVTDMSYLIGYLFSGGPHPVDCAGLKTHVQQDSEGRDILTPGAMTATSK